MRESCRRKAWCLAFLFFTGAAISSRAQTFTTLANFDLTNGAYPGYESLVQGFDGNFYGTTATGGTNPACSGGCGTVFKIMPTGTLTTVHNFKFTDGKFPQAGVIQGSNGDFFGTTEMGGDEAYGNVFMMTPAGITSNLYQFNPISSGEIPLSPLVLGTDGNFYGTTDGGGPNRGGTVFKLTPQGKMTTLYNFCSLAGCLDGSAPYSGLLQATNGNFYGTTHYGGGDSLTCTEGCGTLFEITPAGKLTRLYSFCTQGNCADGAYPIGGIVQASDGVLYGTTAGGSGVGPGTIFKLTLGGELTTIYDFCSQPNCTDGYQPQGTLVQGTDGNLYGTTTTGGMGFCPCGTIFKITTEGVLNTVYYFGSVGGTLPSGGLTQGTDGIFYGTTEWGNGGAGKGYGTVFSLSVGLGPFVKTQPTMGAVGSSIIILGYNLKGTTSVRFDDEVAQFKVVSNTEITATVPTGATSGTVKVLSPGGTLESNVAFRITR